MGQGYSVTTLSAGSAGIDAQELADLTYERSLGNARFMKTIRARHRDGLVVAKVVMKAYTSMELSKYVKILLYERKLLAEVPNALGYHRILETGTNGYLVRQYIHSSLYDRMSTRPFLEDIEKKWIAFQLLCAVRDCHARNIYHGDIKTENILVTSWGWLYLSDFSSSFKPTYLPEDNPADFSFYFDISGRRTCYLAPERFLSSGTQPDDSGRINWAMDIFSVGCVIAELFLETPIFSLSQIFKYRQGEYDPDHVHLNKITDKDIRELVRHMIQVEPEARYAADEYLNFWRKKAFPDYFYNFLHQYMYAITDPTSGRKAVSSGHENFGESDDRIEKIYNDFDKISYFLGSDNGPEQSKPVNAAPRATGSLFPLHIAIPNYKRQIKVAHPAVDDGTLIFLTLIVSSIRSTARASARVQACELLLAFGERTTDEAKLDRIVPYIMSLLVDPSDLVKVAALRTLTQLLTTVNVVSPINASIFPEYIMPRLQPFVPGHKSKPSALIRMTYATCLAPLATTAARFLDMMQALRADGTLPTSDPEAESDTISDSVYQNLFDVARMDLVNQFETQTTALLADTDSAVRRAFLGSVSTLCVFFGSTKASDVILSHLNTYLNDKDWMLKCAFFETIVGVATYVGGASLEEFILPLMVQALTDPEEFVVERALRSLSSMAELGLFQKSKTWELVDVVARFTMHPNPWIREAAAQFVSAATTYLSVADSHCIVVPLIKPYLKVLPSDLSESRLLDALKKPLPRLVLEMASNWALTADKGLFWAHARQQKTFVFGSADETIPTVSAKDLGPQALSRMQKNEEDEQWLTRLRNAAMSVEDEVKLLALREYIWRVSHRRAKPEFEDEPTQFNRVINLIDDLKINLQTVFFDEINKAFEEGNSAKQHDDKGPRTITDALLDASTNAEDPLAHRRASHINSRAERLAREDRKRRASDTSMQATSPIPTDEPSTDEGSRRESVQMRKSRSQASPIEQSPVGSVGTIKLGENGLGIWYKGSAISLLSRGDLGSKAYAETSTTSANAFGKVDGGSSRDASTRRRAASPPLAIAQERNKIDPKTIRYQSAHSYTGHDPSILKLLDTLFLENYPVDYTEFGPTVANFSMRQPIRRDTGQTSNTPWRPEGVLVAMLGEHTAAVTRLAVSPDHVFLVTGSADGSVKIWDTERLERNLTHRSRLTYTLSPGAAVTSLCFLENTHCLAVSGSDGSITILKIPVTKIKDTTRYGKILVLREYQLDTPNEHTTWSEHYKLDAHSILILATSASRILALELRTMALLYELRNPLHHGSLSAFVLDRRRLWLLAGTSHGVLVLWDLRFKLRLRAWGLRAALPINRICLYPSPPSSSPSSRSSKAARRIIIAGGSGPTDISVWDLDKRTCSLVFRAAAHPHPSPSPGSTPAISTPTTSKSTALRAPELIDIDDERPGGMLGRFAGSVEPAPSSTSSNNNSTSSTSSGVRAIAVGAHVPADSSSGSSSSSEPKGFFVISAGPDWKVRFWDGTRVDPGAGVAGSGNTSSVISGLEYEEGKPAYEVRRAEGSIGGTVGVGETVVVVEKAGGRAGGSGISSEERKGKKTGTGTGTGTGKTGKTGVVSVQQQHLLQSHLDEIMDVALVEWPYGMVVSCDRAGFTYVWQ
ncbi:hypothetical protein EJ05DRAFT_455331 [Pseudovirgaria hyperparasitica]|uniref:non-specific serine/threonine protein kinase n=1 Tax=Pseudovirgaria hyperparasitica TaxID=470096 RepID=A0A6A6W2X8_9PEZI|nr:uncharacterized protein EJ05DRAFT_455331 [Pseudovirgaria hyperparasitica]KAF2755391.1 hypothetical protein EJ05DRAFT_455331 [Pseudovirgaria hyperparasitica]